MADYTRSLTDNISFEHLAGYHFFISYTDINFADGHLRTRLHAEAWSDASNSERERALMEATQILERLNFVGAKASSDQTLFFPRDDDTDVPDEIKKACAEIALALLDGVDPELEYQNLRMTSQQYGRIRTTLMQTPPVHLAHGVPSFKAWTFLRPFLRDPQTVSIQRAD